MLSVMHVILQRRRHIDKKGRQRNYQYHILKANSWDYESKAMRSVHIRSLGALKTDSDGNALLPQSKMRELVQIARDKLHKEVSEEDIRNVKRLRIVPDEQAKRENAQQQRLSLDE